MEKEQLRMADENGNEVLYNVLYSFDSEEFNKSYLLIAPDETIDDEEQVDVLAYSFTENEDGSIDEIFPVETDEEWDMIEEVWETLDIFDDEDLEEDEEIEEE